MIVKAKDYFEAYYREKFWEMIPAIYRQEDGLAEKKDVLLALVELMADQAAILRRSQDRLWEDQFIETCDDWAVPYIADLVATRLLSAKNSRGRRIDVAKTIYFRRRKGTPRILEELIYDISDWKGKLVESFQRLARTRHGLDPKPSAFAGRFTGTMPGGVADLRNPAGSGLSTGPFDEYYHIPDFRRPQGMEGRFGITKLNFHLYRLVSYETKEVMPCLLEDLKYTFDPSGRSIPLYNKDAKPFNYNWEEWHSALEWELPLPIRCRLLGDAQYKIKEQHIIDLGVDDATQELLRKLKGIRFRTEGSLRKRVGSFFVEEVMLKLLKYSIVEDCGKHKLWPSAIRVSTGSPSFTIPQELMGVANSDNNNTDVRKELMVDVEKGTFSFKTAPVNNDVLVTYHYGFAGPCGAGFYNRKMANDKLAPPFAADGGELEIGTIQEGSIVQINNSLTYTVVNDSSDIRNIIDFTLQAANLERPFIRLERDWLFSADANEDSRLVLDGLWIGAVTDAPAHKVTIRGDFECIVIRNCTFDPGGANSEGKKLQPIELILDGNVENFCIENSIMGPVKIASPSLLEESFCISDSIVQSLDPAIDAIQVTAGITNIQRSTVLGGISVHRLYASDTIIAGVATVTDTQTGCFRFSTAPSQSRLPKSYESLLFDLLKSNDYWFTSREFGNPSYGQLSVLAPKLLFRGAENGAEMGVFNNLLNAIKFDGLKAKVEEYMPFGLIPAFIYDT